MIARLVLLASLPLLLSCNSGKEQNTIGPPATQALKTSEIPADGKRRLDLLAKQTGFNQNAIFTNYKKRTVAQWHQGWPRRIDLSGVSWSQKQAGTAITPRHILLAAHYKIKNGTSITFHDRAGNVHSRKIVKTISFRNAQATLRSDVAISLLDSPLPPSIKTYRLLPPREDYPHTLPGTPVLVTDQTRHLFIHQIRRIFGHSVSFQKNTNYPENLYKGLIKGDSGNPSFILVGGEPVIIEAHTGGGPGAGPFYSSPELFREIEKAVAELDSNYRIKTVPLDPQLAPAPPKEEPKISPKAPKTNPGPVNPPQTPSQQNRPRVRRVPT